MAVVLLDGQIDWRVERDEMGHREYTVIHRVQGNRNDGPYAVLNCPGLPLVGEEWSFDNDVDGLAWCKLDRKVTPVLTGEANVDWTVESKFSTKPVDYCREDEQLDPLLEPYKLTVNVNKYTEEAVFGLDLDDPNKAVKITNSAHEVIRGPQNEWDAGRATVKITQNRADPETGILIFYLDSVNDRFMWDYFQARCVKFSNFSLERKYHGLCDVYYTRTLEFDCRPDSFDRHLLDEGTKVLNGEWNHVTHAWDLVDIDGFPPNPANPNHFLRFLDPQGNPCRVILDGAGKPWTPNTDETNYWWCVDNGVDPFVEENNCSGITNTAWYWQANVKGPYGSEVEAISACADPNEVGTWPGVLECPEDPNEAGRIYVRKYKEFDIVGTFGPDFPVQIL